MNMELIADKLEINDDTLHAIEAGMASEPTLQNYSSEELRTLLFEILGVLTGDNPRDDFPRTEIDRVVFGVARPHLEAREIEGLNRRIAWLFLWFSTRSLTAA